jgi:hypothetical protein
MTLNEFLLELDNPNSSLKKWIEKLECMLLSVHDKDMRQVFLRYGIIIVAFIENFDPNNRIVRKREIYINKLSNRSKQIIKHHLTDQYLGFLNDKSRYYK